MTTYTLIKGKFYIHYPWSPEDGPQPDGDTQKFLPEDAELIKKLPRPGDPPPFTLKGITKVRFEGIDALETHYKSFHQNEVLALKARDVLLKQTGFGTVEYFDNEPFVVESVEHHPIQGYLLSNGLDQHGRTIAFVFTGNHTDADGTHISVEPSMLENSLNIKMLELGQAYPLFYLSLPANLREYLRSIAVEQKEAGAGLWSSDETMGLSISGCNQLEDAVIWPKLFRRLADFYHQGYTNLADLDGWLRADQSRDDRLLLPNRQVGNMHDLVQVSGDRVWLSHPPEDIVIVPGDYGSIRIICALINPSEDPEKGNETVTILNTTNQDISLIKWFIEDNNEHQELGGSLVRGETRRVRLNSNVQLSNKADTITILDCTDSSNRDRIIDQAVYERRDLPEEGFTKVF